jgi:hypothetical protein
VLQPLPRRLPLIVFVQFPKRHEHAFATDVSLDAEDRLASEQCVVVTLGSAQTILFSDESVRRPNTFTR